MDKLKALMNEKVIPKVMWFTNARYIQILMNAFMGISALTIGGSIFALIRSLPLGDWYTGFLTSTGLMDILNFPIMITSDLISLYLVFALGFFVAKEFGRNTLSGALIALGAFLLLTPFETTATLVDEAGNEVTGAVTGVLPVANFGATGIFLAMITGLVAARLYVWFVEKDIKIKMPASVPENVSNMFETMIPAGCVFILFLVVRVAVAATPFGTAQNLIYTLLQAPLTQVGGGLPGFIVYTEVAMILWIFGVHGSMVVYAGMGAIYNAMTMENLSAFAANVAVPHPEWNFICYTLIGGAGSTLALNLLMLARGKSQHCKTLGKIALPTSLFNINEPLIFGTPVIMNPFLAIPFIVCPLVNLLLSYLVTVIIPIVAAPTGAAISAYMPVGVFAMLNNSSITGLLWVVVLTVIDIVIWYPFFRKFDSMKVKEEQELEAANKAAANA